MPYKEREIERLFYSISEVSGILGVAPSQIRSWEKKFEEIKPRKNKKGDRHYTTDDIALLQRIHALVVQQGLTIRGAKDALKKIKNGDQNHQDERAEMLRILLRMKERVLELLEKNKAGS
jgi:DNA-binding transcriptional MerR regulator